LARKGKLFKLLQPDFKPKMHQIRDFCWGSAPDLAEAPPQILLGLRPRHCWGLQRSPTDPLAGFKGLTSKRREGEGGKRGWLGLKPPKLKYLAISLVVE